MVIRSFQISTTFPYFSLITKSNHKYFLLSIVCKRVSHLRYLEVYLLISDWNLASKDK